MEDLLAKATPACQVQDLQMTLSFLQTEFPGYDEHTQYTHCHSSFRFNILYHLKLKFVLSLDTLPTYSSLYSSQTNATAFSNLNRDLICAHAGPTSHSNGGNSDNSNGGNGQPFIMSPEPLFPAQPNHNAQAHSNTATLTQAPLASYARTHNCHGDSHISTHSPTILAASLIESSSASPPLPVDGNKAEGSLIYGPNHNLFTPAQSQYGTEVCMSVCAVRVRAHRVHSL